MAPVSAAVFIAFGLYTSSAKSTGRGNAFLKAHSDTTDEERLSQEEVQTSLLEEVEGALGPGAATSRLAQLENLLQVAFVALPHNEHGNLGHAAVRYALHRLFVKRHGWFVKGLDPAGSAWNASSPAGILKDQVPAYVHDLFEKRLGEKGLGVHEVAVLAATIEHLVHAEVSGRMAAAFDVHKFGPMDYVQEDEADNILDTYMMSYILGENLKNLTREDAHQFVAEMPEVYMRWSETQQLVRDARTEVSTGLPKQDEVLLDFATLVRAAEKVGEQFGHFQDAECKQLKTSLLRFEDRGTGRVRLSDFYRPSASGSWQFQESTGYLRQLGALDESATDNPRVVVTNYLSSASNCIASSSFYSVCCISECEGLLGHLEAQLKAPEALPQNIAALVGNLSSNSTSRPGGQAAEEAGRAALLAELGGLSIKELRSRAKRQNVPASALEDAADADEPKAALIALLTDLETTAAATAPRNLTATLRRRLDEIAAGHAGMVPLHSRMFSQWMHHAFPRECPYPHLSGTTSSQSPEEWMEGSGVDATATEEEMQQYMDNVTNLTVEPGAVQDGCEFMPWSEEEELLVVRPAAVHAESKDTDPDAARNMLLFAILGSMAFSLVATARSLQSKTQKAIGKNMDI